ncbi:MAG: response regulator, partial [Candidatus Sericytochromatia bacterium]
RLKANPALKDIPVVMMSILENRALAFGMGASECLIKPVARERLLDVLRQNAEAEGPVLVVDDEADARALVTDILTAAGYRSVEAANGEEALKAIAEERPSLVVLDLMMPEMNGFTVLERLGEDPRLRTLPVVVLTAMALSPEDEARLHQSALLVLQKAQTSPDTLLADLESVLRSRVKR